MAEYLIQGETLDAIAKAINQKAGTQNSMTPAEMATAIAAIPSGGGELLVDNVASEDVATINLVIPQGKQSYRMYVVELKGRTSTNDWIYPRINTTTPGTTGAYLPQKQSYNSKFPVVRYAYGDEGFAIPLGAAGNSSSVGITSTALNNIFLSLYNSSSVFRAGFVVKVWGYNI